MTSKETSRRFLVPLLRVVFEVSLLFDGSAAGFNIDPPPTHACGRFMVFPVRWGYAGFSSLFFTYRVESSPVVSAVVVSPVSMSCFDSNDIFANVLAIGKSSKFDMAKTESAMMNDSWWCVVRCEMVVAVVIFMYGNDSIGITDQANHVISSRSTTPQHPRRAWVGRTTTGGGVWGDNCKQRRLDVTVWAWTSSQPIGRSEGAERWWCFLSLHEEIIIIRLLTYILCKVIGSDISQYLHL